MIEEKVYVSVKKSFELMFGELEKAVVGQKDVIENLMIALLCEGHALLEGFPGLGKTMIVSNLAKILDLKFARIQCTPDIMPSDVTGTYIIEEQEGRKVFRLEKGPVFTNILLADEINRATPKAQSALLEAMQEKQVTLGNKTYKLERPFFVLATQNPIEMEGTYPLPEAQLDRFLLKVLVDYSTFEEEDRIVDMYASGATQQVNKIMDRETLLALQNLTRQVPISEETKKYALKLVTATRAENEYIEYGASPRASIGLVLTAKARALIHGKNFVGREDIKAMAYPVMRHRIILTFDAERKGISQDMVIESIIKSLE
ncbi:MAG: MoxR family ATPase [Euryarchaeota archaeon]|nr:MoxR family ATPase [Euryarchaeota archaeon]